MITWMQRHKKYLVVTIWISVIAFVGAGFVGWGAYDFNTDRASAVAKVADRKVTVQEFQLAYSNFYNYYNNLLGGELTKEKADQMGLEKIVLENVINEAVLLSYADEIGLSVLDSEIKDKIANDDAFKENGVFNKDAYYRVLKGSAIAPKDYENSLKKQLLLAKIQQALELKASGSEADIFRASIFMQDKLSVGLVTLDASELGMSDDEIKKYWQEHQTEYLSEKSYDLDIIKVPLSNAPIDPVDLKAYFDEKQYNYKDAEGKILSFDVAKETVTKDYRLKESKKDALTTYLQLKKGEIQTTESLNVLESDENFPVDELKNASIDQVLKPLETKDGYIVVKLKSINTPLPKSFQDARAQVLIELEQVKKQTALRAKAEARLEVFAGNDIGFVSRDSKIKIPGLDEAQSLEFINHVFDTNAMKGYQIIDNKAVLYTILEQKLLRDDKTEQYTQMIDQNVAQIKNTELNQNLLSMLKKRYDIEQYYKGN